MYIFCCSAGNNCFSGINHSVILFAKLFQCWNFLFGTLQQNEFTHTVYLWNSDVNLALFTITYYNYNTVLFLSVCIICHPLYTKYCAKVLAPHRFYYRFYFSLADLVLVFILIYIYNQLMNTLAQYQHHIPHRGLYRFLYMIIHITLSSTEALSLYTLHHFYLNIKIINDYCNTHL